MLLEHDAETGEVRVTGLAPGGAGALVLPNAHVKGGLKSAFKGGLKSSIEGGLKSSIKR